MLSFVVKTVQPFTTSIFSHDRRTESPCHRHMATFLGAVPESDCTTSMKEREKPHSRCEGGSVPPRNVHPDSVIQSSLSSPEDSVEHGGGTVQALSGSAVCVCVCVCACGCKF